MSIFSADLHNHTVLSPCGDIEMTPDYIIRTALKNGYDIIGITDHNSTLQGREIMKIAGDSNLYILCGAEITTKEEVHCLAFVDGEDKLNKLQNYLNEHLPKILNNPDIFGYQLVVDKNENVLYEEENLLISAINQSIEQVEKFIHSLDGIFIPAHIDKSKNSIISQLGFIPTNLKCDAFEFSKNCDINAFVEANKYLLKLNSNFIRSSDAHYTDDFATTLTYFNMEYCSFSEIKMALNGENGRFVKIIK